MTPPADCIQSWFNDFETNDVGGWLNFTGVSTAVEFSNYLGPFSRSMQPTKVFTIPASTKNVRVRFSFLQLLTWDGNGTPYGPDKFKVYVNKARLVDFGFFGSAKVDDTGMTTDGMNWTRKYLDGTYQKLRYLLMIDVPQAVLNDKPGELTLRFFGDTSQPLWDEASGIDNVTIITCSRAVFVP